MILILRTKPNHRNIPLAAATSPRLAVNSTPSWRRPTIRFPLRCSLGFATISQKLAAASGPACRSCPAIRQLVRSPGSPPASRCSSTETMIVGNEFLETTTVRLTPRSLLLSSKFRRFRRVGLIFLSPSITIFMSDGQREHALAIEHLVPSLGVLRVKLRGYTSDEQFWMIYFILLLPRLNGHDIKLLSTPKIVQARDALLQKLENRSYRKSKIPDASQDSETPVGRVAALDSEDATGKWLEDIDDTNASLVVLTTHKHEEDVSFTDLEDDESDHPGRSSSIGVTQETWSSSPTGSSDWVQLKNESRGSQKTGRAISQGRESESDGSNSWLTVDYFD